MDEYQAFYEMVKKWTVNDYKTQSIKSEVIVDMLISDFIEEIVAANLENIEAKDVVLLAKEFPIKTNNKTNENNETNNNRNAKADYLLMAKKDLYLVELKTSNESLNEDQKKRMDKTRNAGVEELWNFFFKIVEGKLDATAKKKYRFTQARMQENLQKRLSVHPSNMRSYLTNSDFKINILYICLCRTAKSRNTKGKTILEPTPHIYLKDLNENRKFIKSLQDKKTAWDKLYCILQQLFTAAEYMEGKYKV